MLNKVILIGNLTRDVELRYTNTGTAVSKIGLATNRRWKDRNSGEDREEVLFIDCNVFGRSAEVANQHLRKGSKVLVEGRIQMERWVDQNGQNRTKHSIVAENFQFLDSKDTMANGQSNGYQPQNNGYDNSNDYENSAPRNSNVNKQQDNSTKSYNNDINIDDDSIPF